MGGRLILVKFVLLSILVYFHSFFKVPSNIIFILESIFNAFFFAGGWGVGCDVRIVGQLLGLNEILFV